MNILYFEKLDSTNTYSKLNIESLEDKCVVSAGFQSAGRGRFTRTWTDVGNENIYISIVLKPSDEIKDVYANLTQYASVCLCRVFEKHGVVPKIKWPNDVLLENKKVCGILAESVIKGSKLKGIVLGIGVNLNSSEKVLAEIDRPATALNLILGKNVDKNNFLNEFLSMFFDGYENFLAEGFSSIKQYYLSNSFLTINESINVAIFDKTKSGQFIGFDDSGNLLLSFAGGHVENINMGEIV